jgi:undecaprenyl-diphosphatase
VFVIAFLEALVGIGLIMPGSVLTVFSGWLAFQGRGSIHQVMIAAAIGALLGDLLSYWIGARFGPRIWHCGFLKKRQELLKIAELVFFEHGGKSVFFGRFLGPIRGLVPFVAGASMMPPKAFLLFSLISGLLWGISYPGIGYLGGSSWQQAETILGRLSLLLLIVLAATVILTLLRHHFLPKHNSRHRRNGAKMK